MRNWDNLQTRSCNVPDKVFVGIDGFSKYGPNYEYSVDPPSHFDIEDILEGHYSKNNFIQLFYCLPEVFAPINEIASRVADAVWLLKKFTNDEVDWKNEQFNRLFSKPNPLMAFKQFIWQSVCYEYLTGANFSYLNIPGVLSNDFENINTWYNLPSNKVCIDKKNNVDIYSADSLSDFVKNYYITNKNGQKRIFDPEKVIQITHFDLCDGNEVDKYKSPLTGAKKPIRNLIPVYEARNVIYVKRGAMGFIVSKKSDASGTVALTPKEKKESQEEYQATYGLSHHKSQVGVMSAPVEYVSTGMSIKDLEPFEETLADAVAIYKVLRVPSHLVPRKDNSTFANADADMRSFYNDVIIPLAKKYAESFTSKFNIKNRYIDPDFSHIPFLQENKKEKSETERTQGVVMEQRFKNGVCTLNDWIVAVDGDKSTDPLYDKKIFEMTPEELQRVKDTLNLNINQNGTTPEDKGEEANSEAA